MAYLSLAEIARLNTYGMRPEAMSLLTRLMATVEAELGLRTFVRDFGGYRPKGVQQQLKEWRDKADAKDGIIGGGKDFYAVAPVGSSHHEWGAAFDLGIVEPAKRTDANYKAIADISKRIGLTPGYYFRKKDEFHHQLDESLHDVKTRWQAMRTNRAAALAVVVLLLVFFFPAISSLV